jgi:hypothetical protein
LYLQRICSGVRLKVVGFECSETTAPLTPPLRFLRHLVDHIQLPRFGDARATRRDCLYILCELGHFLDDLIRNPAAPRQPEERPVQPTRKAASAASNERCRLRCYSRKLSADHIAFPAEIFDRGPSGNRKNSETVRCFAAVFRCSCGDGVQKGPPRRWLPRVGVIRSTCLHDNATSYICQYNNIFSAWNWYRQKPCQLPWTPGARLRPPVHRDRRTARRQRCPALPQRPGQAAARADSLAVCGIDRRRRQRRGRRGRRRSTHPVMRT